MSKNTKKSEAGFSILEILIATFIFSIISAILMTFMSQQLKTVNYMSDLMSKDDFKREIHLILDDVASCDATLKDYVVDLSRSKKLNKIVDKNGKTAFMIGNKYSKLNITNINVTNRTAAVDSTGVVDINFTLKRSRSGGGPNAWPGVSIPVVVNLDAAGKIKSCGDLERFAITSLSLTSWNGGAKPFRILPQGYKIPFDMWTTGKNNSTGNIKLNDYGAIIQESGCYEVSLDFAVQGSTSTPSSGKEIRVSWYRHNAKGYQKLAHLLRGSVDLYGGTRGAEGKRRTWPFTKGDQLVAFVTANSSHAYLLRASTILRYSATSCNILINKAYTSSPR